MGTAQRRLRVGLGVGLASAAVAAPVGMVAHLELAEHWAWAGPTGVLWTVLAVTWVVVAGAAAYAARRLPADKAPLVEGPASAASRALSPFARSWGCSRP